MKRIVSLLLTFAMLIGMLPITAWSTESDAVSGTCGENLEWKLNANGTLIISGTGEMVDYSYESPAPWIRSNTNIAVTAIVFEGSVTKIGASAFSGLDEMESITIPETVTEIGDNAFSGCCKLTAITIPEAVTYIGEYAFFNCTAVEEIYYCAEAAEEIGTRAFALVGTDCKDTVVTIANTVKEIPASLFYADTTEDGCYPHITDVNFEDNSICESIGELAFWQCVDLTEVDIPKSVKTIGWGAFYGCSSLDKVNYAGTEDLWNDIDIGSDNDILTDHEIHYGESTDPSPAPHEHSYGDWYETKAPTLDAEGEERRDCTGCDHYEIRATDKLPVTEDSGNTCGENLTWTLVDGVLTVNGTGDMDQYSENNPAPWYELRNEITSVVINNGVENISESAFAECSSIVSIDIADSVNSIGPYAFKDCSALTSIDIPDAEQYIGMGTFMGCTSLESVSLPDNLLGIGYEAFRDCESLESISIPASVTEIEDGAFYHCTSLETIALPSTELTLEGGVFNGCSSLKAISIPEGTTTIGNAMFADCVNLESVELPSSVTVIHIAAFSGCTSLKSIVLPDKVTTIKNAAFNECSNLNSVTIPASVNSIETAAFGSCDALVDVYYAGTEDQWKEITIDELNDGLANATIHYQSAGGSSPEHHKHSYTAVTTAPTCTEQGYTTYTCSCNDSYVSDYVDAKGHSYGDWYETKAPTQGEDGEERRDCIECNHFETRSNDMALHAHVYTANVTAPTCTEKGYTTYTCQCSDRYVDDYVDATGHAYDNGVVTTEPGCETEGVKTFTCINDKTHTYVEVLPVIGHSLVGWYEIAATTHDGVTVEQQNCEHCQYFEARVINSNTLTTSSLLKIIVDKEKGYCFVNSCDRTATGIIVVPESVLGYPVTRVSSNAFKDCVGIERVILPDCVTEIQSYAFANCSNLQSIDLSKRLVQVDVGVFSNCSSLKKLTFYERLGWLHDRAIYGCDQLEYIDVEGNNKTFYSVDGVLFRTSYSNYGETHITLERYPTGKKGNYIVPDIVTSIGESAFHNCCKLTSVTIPNSVTKIYDYAFSACGGLNDITIPDGVESIRWDVFSGCGNLINATILPGPTDIWYRAFLDCGNLKSVVIPNSVTCIWDSAFHNCNNLSDVYYSGTKSEWAAITIMEDNEGLKNATIHYNSTGSSSGYTGDGTVRYFSKWDADKQIAYFGTQNADDDAAISYQVTQETDMSFLENIDSLLNTYVLVESKPSETLVFVEELISIRPVETKLGVVTSADENTIVIDGETYTTPADLMFPSTYVGVYVRYFLYEGTLVGVLACSDGSGISVRYLTGYDDGTKVASFGILEQSMLQITERTNMAFAEDLGNLVNNYVLVEMNVQEEGLHELLSITPVQTNIGTVSAQEDLTATIGEKTYTVANEDILPYLRPNTFVLFHTQDERIVGSEYLQTVPGKLVGWDSKTKEITLEISGDSGSEKYNYTLSELADQNSVDFLNGLLHEASLTVVEMLISVDTQGLVYFAGSQKPGYRLEISTSTNGVVDEMLEIELGQSVQLNFGLYFNDKAVDMAEQPQLLVRYSGQSKLFANDHWEKLWLNYRVILTAATIGTAYITVIDRSSGTYANVTIQINPVNTSEFDDPSRVEWVTKHIQYATSDLYKEQVVNGFPGALQTTFEEIKNDKSIKAYNTLDKFNDVIGFDFASLNETEKYELLLIQILFSRNGTTCIEDMYDVYLSKTLIEALDYYLKIDGILSNKDYDKLYDLVKNLKNTKFGSLEFNDTLKKAFKQIDLFEVDINKIINSTSVETGFDFGLGLASDQITTECKTVSQYLMFMAAGEAYYRTSDRFGQMLLEMRRHLNVPSDVVTLNEPLLNGEDLLAMLGREIPNDYQNGYGPVNPFDLPISIGELCRAIENIYLGLEDYKETGGELIARSIKSAYETETGYNIFSNGTAVAMKFIESIPVIKAFSVIKKFFKNAQFVIDNFTKIDDNAAHGTMVMRLYCIARVHYLTVNSLAMTTDSWDDGISPGSVDRNKQFDKAMLFDESVAVYRAILNVASEYAQQYRAGAYNVLNKGDHIYGIKPATISPLESQQRFFNYEWCHQTLAEYLEENGAYSWDPKNLLIYEVKCPVEVTVKNELGAVIAVLRNGNSQIPEGYEHYFFTTETVRGSGDYLKIAMVPDSFAVTIQGTDTGTMNATVTEFVNQQLGETRFFYNIPITKETNCAFVDSTNSAGVKQLIVNNVTLDGETEIPTIHVPDSDWITDGTQHWHKCTGCDEKLNPTDHSGGTATCTKKAVCSTCGTSYGELAPHDYETSWSQGDANGHWHECKNCSTHDTQVKHTPGAAATETTALFCTVCDYVITPALGHTCTAGSKWYSNGTYHWHVCTSCGAWVKTSYHSYSSNTDETCNVCGCVRTVTTTEPTEATEAVMTETTEATIPDEEMVATETLPTIASTEVNESLSNDAVSEDTDSHRVSGVLITVFTVVAFGSLAALAILLVYKKRRESK